MIQQTLNHSSLTVTQVYARLTIQPVRRALDEQAGLMLGTVRPPLSTPEQQNKEWPG